MKFDAKKLINPIKPRKVGRPKKFETPEEMGKLMDKYFASCWEKDEDGTLIKRNLYTVSGLANYLSMDRTTLFKYGKLEAYETVVGNAKSLIEEQNEELLYTGQGTTGIMFILKNNFGWKDKQEIETNGIREVIVVDSWDDLEDE